MAHMIESAMIAGAAAWWESSFPGLGVHIPDNVSWADALKIADLDWNVRLQKTFVRDMRETEHKAAIECAGYRAVVRETDSSVLAVVSDRYRVIQNRDMFELFQAAFGDRAVLETAFSIRGGREVAGLARIPEPWKIGNDAHWRYLLVTGGHDGRHDVKALPTAVRVVCNNTLRAALAAAKDAQKGTFENGYAVRHVGDTGASLKTVASMIEQAFGAFNGYATRMEALQETALTPAEFAEILERSIIPGDSGKARTARETIVELSKNGQGNEPYRGTAYAALQGVTEFVDHHRLTESQTERRFRYTMDGTGAALKSKAETVLVQEYAPSLLDSVIDATPVQ